MPSPLSTPRSMSEPAAWQELEEVFARLGHLARTDLAPEDFYGKLLEESVRALSAVGATACCA